MSAFSPSNHENQNSQEYLELNLKMIVENLRHVASAPSVQMQRKACLLALPGCHEECPSTGREVLANVHACMQRWWTHWIPRAKTKTRCVVMPSTLLPHLTLPPR